MTFVKTHALKILALALLLNVVATAYILYLSSQYSKKMASLEFAMAQVANTFVASGIIEKTSDNKFVVNEVVTTNIPGMGMQ